MAIGLYILYIYFLLLLHIFDMLCHSFYLENRGLLHFQLVDRRTTLDSNLDF